MKLAKAIEILKAHETSVGLTPPIHLRPAINLAIEALKVVEKWRAEHRDLGFLLLPGETED